MELRRDGEVFILDLGSGENRIGREFVEAFDGALDRVEAADPPRALVTTASGRFWSNGFDLEELTVAEPEERRRTTAAAEHLLARLLVAPFPTVAALVGHTYAAGALVALAHDLRVMRVDRGFFCLPSVDVGIPFTEGMARLIAAKVPQPGAHLLAVAGLRYGGDEAVRLGAVHEAVPEGRVLSRAVALARELAEKDPYALGTVKARLYAESHRLLADAVGIDHL